MSLRDRRIVSAMTPEAEETAARAAAEGLDPVTGKPLRECGVDCACEAKHGKADGKGKKGGGNDEGGQA